MKQWIGLLLQNKYRRLEISSGGGWFLLFIILLGVSAIFSGNNIIYLIESLLLSALIFSGLLSEQTVKNIRITRLQGQAKVGASHVDTLIVENLGVLPLFCIEIGEWSRGKQEMIAFVLSIPGRGKVRLSSMQKGRERGKHAWEAMTVSTSFPFGFARKIRFIYGSGSRIVWAADEQGEVKIAGERDTEGKEFSFGEVEEIPEGGDVSRVHWPSSARASALLAIPRKYQEVSRDVCLDWCSPGEERERRIRVSTAQLQTRGASARLIIYRGKKREVVFGKWSALDALALLPKEGA